MTPSPQRHLPPWLTRLLLSAERTRWEYPYPIWAMTGGMFINTFGGSMVFPIFSLYFTEKFDLSLTQAGLLLMMFVLGGFIGQPLGGYLTDRFGRKGIMVFALCAEAVFSMGMAFAPNVAFLAVDIALFGLTVPMFGPSSSAMVADLVKPERRAATYGLIRVAANAGVALGPTVAALMLTFQRRVDGTLPDNAYLPLFVADAVTSLIFAWIIATRLYETRPTTKPVAPTASSSTAPAATSATDGGFRAILSDRVFMVMVILYALVGIVYSQMNTTFGVYMHQTFNIPQEHYGFMLASNAAMVVLFQFSIARWVDKYERGHMLALGAALYGLGFGMVGWFSSSFGFEVAMVVMTLGEMVIVPASQTLVADLSPVNMRGRYQAMYGVMAGLGHGVGPVLGGWLFDMGQGAWIWHSSLLLGLLIAVGYYFTTAQLKRRAEVVNE